MIVKTEADFEGLKQIGKIVANCLHYMAKKMEPGMTTWELDQLGGAFLEKHGARSGPKLVYNFPGYNCISLNHEVAHGVPSNKKISAGDLINIDVSAELNGYYADNGGSFIVPPSSPNYERLLKATKMALQNAIDAVKAKENINIIGKKIEEVAQEYGYSIIQNLGSHGVGRGLHEEPTFIAGYYDPKDQRRLKEGQVITIEPFLSTGARFVDEEADGWTLVAGRNHRSAQFEHTMIIGKDRATIVTVPDSIYL